MRFVIVTGMSGAGKTTVLKMLEDVGYFCVDNLPIPLITKFAELLDTPANEINKVAIGIDIRSGQALGDIPAALELLKNKEIIYEILFLDCSDDVLVKRFKETRRSHPLSLEGRVDDGIKIERKKLEFLKKSSNYIMDTSLLLTRQLKNEIKKIFVNNKNYKSLNVTILSFGFKYGIPTDSDLVFDVRFMPNPYYNEAIKNFTGQDKEVRDFVMNPDVSKEFLKKLIDMIKFLIPTYIEEGKNQLVISVGCTGGKHRSVTIACELFNALKKDEIYGINITHRDIEKDNHVKKS